MTVHAQPPAFSVSIDVVLDVVCPWCFLGKRRLEAAIAALPAIPVTIRWRPFQLDPTIPAEGVDHREHLIGKFGDLSRLDEAHRRLVALGADEDIDYQFDQIERSPNTIDAHRLIRWATEIGEQDAAVERLFTLHFTEGADIGDHEVLANLAAELGFDRDTIADRLASDEDKPQVHAEIAAIQELGITGVPCFILAGKYAVMGAQPAEQLTSAISKVAAELSAQEPL